VHIFTVRRTKVPGFYRLINGYNLFDAAIAVTETVECMIEGEDSTRSIHHTRINADVPKNS
jgi:hypothetical protein